MWNLGYQLEYYLSDGNIEWETLRCSNEEIQLLYFQGSKNRMDGMDTSSDNKLFVCSCFTLDICGQWSGLLLDYIPDINRDNTLRY